MSAKKARVLSAGLNEPLVGAQKSRKLMGDDRRDCAYDRTRQT